MGSNEPKYIIDSPPGIMCQEDFDHDFKLLIKHINNRDPELAFRAHCLIQLSIEKGYHLNW